MVKAAGDFRAPCGPADRILTFRANIKKKRFLNFGTVSVLIGDQEIATITRELKEIAGEYGVPVIALSQLNRESEKRNDKRPQASDLRESGAIEADADIIILVHREDAYEPESPRAGEADLIVEKNRNGPRATITVASQLHFSKFSDMAGDYPPTPPPSARPDSSGRPNLTVVH